MRLSEILLISTKKLVENLAEMWITAFLANLSTI